MEKTVEKELTLKVPARYKNKDPKKEARCVFCAEHKASLDVEIDSDKWKILLLKKPYVDLASGHEYYFVWAKYQGVNFTFIPGSPFQHRPKKTDRGLIFAKTSMDK
jgi:hypothetical protein